MAELASLSLEVDSSKVQQAVATLNELPKAASAAERAAAKWSATTKDATDANENFSRRVQKTIADLKFETEQLARNTSEKQKYATLRRAGVTEASAEGQAILASVKALQAQKAALGETSLAARAFGTAWERIRDFATGTLLARGVEKIIEMAKGAFEAAAGMQELADTVGLAADSFQALLYVGVQNGLSTEKLQNSMGKFSQKMGEAAEGSKTMIDALKDLGIKNLDAQGKLRPTEDLLVDVAKAITSIDDPARKSAAAVAFFGKSGMAMLPVLADISKGMGDLKASAEAAGAIIGDQTIAKLDAAADRAERNSLVIRKLAADSLAYLLDFWNANLMGVEKLASMIWDKAKEAAGAFKSFMDETITPFADKVSIEAARAGAAFMEPFKALPDILGAIFEDVWTTIKSKTIAGVNSVTQWFSDNAPEWLGGGRGGTNMPVPAPTSGASTMDIGAAMEKAGNDAAAAMQDRIKQARLAASRGPAAGSAFRATSGARETIPTTGGGLSTSKDASKEAENQIKKYNELIATLNQTADAQDKMTEAAGKGGLAFDQLKTHVDAQNKVLEIFGKKLDDNDPRLQELEKLMTRIAQGKIAENFQVATTELQNQNVILQAQIDLMNQAPEIQAKEIALIKAKQEAEKAGTAVTQDMIDARKAAIEQNETLKTQAEELKRVNELWTAPLKSALESIQSTAADAFEQMLTSGNFTFQSLADTFKKTITRMIAEFLALATVRPVMSVLVNAVSPNLAQQMGLGTGQSATASQGGSLFGGLGSLGGGGGGGIFSGISDWLGTPMTGPYAGMSPSSMAGVPVLGPGANGSLGSTGITGLGALGALAGAGMGAYNLFTSKSTGQTIGGIASLVGAGVSLIPGIGQIAGPIIGLLGGLLPGLFGGGTPEPPTMQGIGSLDFSGGRFRSASAGYGGGSGVDLSGFGNDIKNLLTSAKVNIDKLTGSYGIIQQTFSKGDFSNATTFVNGQQWGQSSNPEAQKQALDSAIAHITQSMILEVGSGASDIMREGLGNWGRNENRAFSTQDLANAIAELNGLDEAIKTFGHTSTDAETQIKGINDSFNELYNTAAKYNLSQSVVDQITNERTRKQQEAVKPFMDSVEQGLLEFADPLQAQLRANDIEYQKALETNATYVQMVVGYEDQKVRIESLYSQKRLKIIDDFNQQAVAQQKALEDQMLQGYMTSFGKIQDLLRELQPGGSLSGLDPRSQMVGLKATADASLAQAMADPTNTTLIDKAVSDQRAFIDFNKGFTGGSVDYQRDVQSRIGLLQNLGSSLTQTTMNQTSDPITHSYLQQILAAVSTNQSAVDNVMALLSRYLANGQVTKAA